MQCVVCKSFGAHVQCSRCKKHTHLMTCSTAWVCHLCNPPMTTTAPPEPPKKEEPVAAAELPIPVLALSPCASMASGLEAPTPAPSFILSPTLSGIVEELAVDQDTSSDQSADSEEVQSLKKKIRELEERLARQQKESAKKVKELTAEVFNRVAQTNALWAYKHSSRVKEEKDALQRQHQLEMDLAQLKFQEQLKLKDKMIEELTASLRNATTCCSDGGVLLHPVENAFLVHGPLTPRYIARSSSIPA